MSEEAEAPPEAVLPKKGRLGMIVGIVIAVVTLVGGSVAGAVLGPKLLGGSEEHEEEEKPAKGDKSHKTEKKDKKQAHGSDDEDTDKDGEHAPEHIVTVDIPSVVVDLLDPQGRIRHLKVGLTAELADKVPAEEFRLFIPRGREAALVFLRSLAFEQVADPSQFGGIKDELAKKVSEAVGEERVHRMMLTDFVLQ